jgi:hypothetical protein
MDKYTVTDQNGNVITQLNHRLAEKQKITDDKLEALKLSHQLRWILFEAAKKVLDEPLKLKMLANVFDALETEQQKLWNFEVNLNYHYFFSFPGCKCPKLDNQDRLGTSHRIISQGCPIHSDIIK